MQTSGDQRRENANTCSVSSSAKADDPVFQRPQHGIEGPQRTGYPPSRGTTTDGCLKTESVDGVTGRPIQSPARYGAI